jgi:hypothetical protein
MSAEFPAPLFVVIAPNGVDRVSEHGEALEEAIAVCRKFPGSFVLEATAGVPMTQPTVGDALARWQRQKRDEVRAAEIARRPPGPPREPKPPRSTAAPSPKHDAAVAWLSSTLAAGPISAIDLDARARAVDLAAKVKLPEVRRAAGAIAFRRGRVWWLALASCDLPADAVVPAPRRGTAA